MVLAFNANHIINYHLYAQQSTHLAWTYFTNLGHMFFQCWVCAAYSSPNKISHTETHVYHYTKFLKCSGLHTLGFTCTKLVTVICFANAALPNVLTAYWLYSLLISPVSWYLIISGVIKHP